MVLITGIGEDIIKELCKEGVVSGLSMFHSLMKWIPELKTGCRLVWVLCWGYPSPCLGFSEHQEDSREHGRCYRCRR